MAAARDRRIDPDSRLKFRPEKRRVAVQGYDILLSQAERTFAASTKQNVHKMEKRTVDPWIWGERTNSVQAVEVTQPAGTLFCSGQVAINANGVPSAESMRLQLLQTFRNLEQLIGEAGYECKGIVRLNVYTTSVGEFFGTCMDVYQEWLTRHGIRQAATLLEVKGLFATLNIELEATVVR